MTWTGRIEWVDLEGGFWRLVAGNDRFVLRGEIPKELAGHEVEVSGELSAGASFFMAGPVIAVTRVRRRP